MYFARKTSPTKTSTAAANATNSMLVIATTLSRIGDTYRSKPAGVYCAIDPPQCADLLDGHFRNGS